jgi:hypothetical protein
MKQSKSLIVLVSLTMVLVGCSTPSPTASKRPAIDLVQAGRDVEFALGSVVHVREREGSALQGIHIVLRRPGVQDEEITAETGTIKSGTPENSNFINQVTITLHDAKVVTGSTNFTAYTEQVVLYK